MFNNVNKSVKAQADENDKTPSISYEMIKAEADYESTAPNSLSHSKLSSSYISSVGYTHKYDFDSSPATITIERTQSGSHTFEIYLVYFRIVVKLPAHSSYKVSNKFQLSNTKITGTANTRSSLLYYGEGTYRAAELKFKSEGTYSIIHNLNETTGSSTKSITFENTTDDVAEFYIYADVWQSTASKSTQTRAKLSITSTLTEMSHEHNMMYVAASAPTCVTPGDIEHYYCNKCGKHFSDSDGATELETVEVPATGIHSFTTYTSDGNATCGTDGTKTATCDNCTETSTITDTGSATGQHSFTNYTSNNDATCNADGTKTATCDNCTATSTVTDAGTATGNHTPGASATCITPQTCTDCGTELVAATGAHSYTNYVPDGNATCTADGTKTAHCDTNGCTATDTIPDGGSMVSHSFTNYVSNNNATCTADGTKTAHCDYNCGATDTLPDSGSMTPHSFTNYVSDGDADCLTDGHETAKCDNCTATDKRVEVGSKLGHDWGEWKHTTEPTEYEDGEDTRTCNRCDETETKPVAALGHNHTFSEDWTSDDDNHWHAATCPHTDEKDGNAAHSWNDGEVTKEATFTDDGEKTYTCSVCQKTRTEVIPAKGVSPNEITIDLGTEFEYGDAITPVVSSNYGEITLVWYDNDTGDELDKKPSTPGSYKLVARVEENLEEGYAGAEKEVAFTITKRAITVTINPASSVAGDELEALTATVTSGSIVNGDEPYTLSTNAIAETMGEYEITGECTDDNYEITFENAVYIVSKKVEDEGGNEIDMPTDIDVEFKVTQRQTGNDYAELAGMKCGYWAQLWYRNGDGTLGDEYTDKMNCILTLKIPDEIIEAIRGDEPIDRKKITDGLRVYYVDEDGDLKKVKPFTITQKEDESWIIRFNYNSTFRAEVVFHALGIEEAGKPAAAAGIPWWVWLIVGLAGAALVGVVVVIIVVIKKKNNGDGGVMVTADNGEVIGRLDKQDEKLDKIKEIVDGGFNDMADE